MTFEKFSFTVKDKRYEFLRPQVMGILNVTPDSFYAGSRMATDVSLISSRIRQMLEEGVDIIDIGAYSTRPNADEVPPEEEYRRLSVGLDIIRSIAGDILVSVDTFRAEIAELCVKNYGVQIINDVSGGTLDAAMFDTVSRLGVPYILMHMRGTPATMQSLTDYADVTDDVIADLTAKADALRNKGVKDIIIDPGFGFSKTVDQNYEMMARLEEFKKMGLPLLVGISRKSMIFRTLDTDARHSLNGTTVLNTVSLMGGAQILRVHDVRVCVEAVKIMGKMLGYDY
ncbi:MAG: dihydropteroate synthase [Muribaculaceae bacterium]